MWDKLLKYLPGLLINGIPAVRDIILNRGKSKLADIKVYCDQVEAGLLTAEQAIELIKSLVK